MSDLLRVEGLSKLFGGYTAVVDVDFHVEAGEVLGIVGPNGAGKTTTFNVVSGFLSPSRGRIRFRGHDVTGWAPHKLARHGLVRTFQHTRVFERSSVRDNIRIASHKVSQGGVRRLLFGNSQAERESLEARIDEILAIVGLADKAELAAAELPYGEQRILEIAVALAADPLLLLLDEPFAGMNDTECARCMELIHLIRERRITVVVIDHHIETMARGCDRLVVMHYGTKLAEGTPQQVTEDPRVIDAYLGVNELSFPDGSHRDAVMEPEPLLELSGVAVHYGQVQALADIDLTVHSGEIVALIGSNGAGKTSTLRAVSGLLPTTAGNIRFRGSDLGGVSPARRVKDGLAHCPEGREVFPAMTVLENLELGAPNERFARERLPAVFELFPRLEERLTQAAGSLSGGEQQMLAIGRALMSDPRLLLLDEPSLGLAPYLARTVAEAIVALNRCGVAVLIVEQNASLALAIAHRAYVLSNGRVTLVGSAQEVRSNPVVRESYLGSA